METRHRWKLIFNLNKSPTRLEGMETIKILSRIKEMYTSPTRLEGMETDDERVMRFIGGDSLRPALRGWKLTDIITIVPAFLGVSDPP